MSCELSIDQLAEIAIDVVRVGMAIALDPPCDLAVDTKSNRNDLVTAVDRAIEEEIAARLEEATGLPLLGEEGHAVDSFAGRVWDELRGDAPRLRGFTCVVRGRRTRARSRRGRRRRPCLSCDPRQGRVVGWRSTASRAGCFLVSRGDCYHGHQRDPCVAEARAGTAREQRTPTLRLRCAGVRRGCVRARGCLRAHVGIPVGYRGGDAYCDRVRGVGNAVGRYAP